MGTGIVSLLLTAIPFTSDWLYWLAVVFFGLNTVLFTSAFLISVIRYTVYPEIWKVMIADSVNSLFLGTIPMGFATLVNAWCCWIIDAAVAVAVTISLTVLLISASHRQALDRITAAQLLPIAASIVAAGAGARVSEHLPNPERALGTIITSYVMWGMSTPLAMTVLVMYYTPPCTSQIATPRDCCVIFSTPRSIGHGWIYYHTPWKGFSQSLSRN